MSIQLLYGVVEGRIQSSLLLSMLDRAFRQQALNITDEN